MDISVHSLSSYSCPKLDVPVWVWAWHVPHTPPHLDGQDPRIRACKGGCRLWWESMGSEPDGGSSPSSTTFRHCMCACSVVSDSLQPIDYSPPVSSVCGLSQAKRLEWVAIFYSRGSSHPGTELKSVSLHWQADYLPLSYLEALWHFSGGHVAWSPFVSLSVLLWKAGLTTTAVM